MEPLSSLSPYVSWVLADAVLHCYTAPHCLVAADGTVGLVAVIVMSEVLLVPSVSKFKFLMFIFKAPQISGLHSDTQGRSKLQPKLIQLTSPGV
ncbi:hypothetical protein UY3_19063 [Chelonia mydas]|uniref:Uncharacterized protein n=1 Tax=Chelonia mydas TaxID=8469 RepID=M7AHV5_CHEMY|nr:hypothetical protein UY3_19063 [Chelonia mydas]